MVFCASILASDHAHFGSTHAIQDYLMLLGGWGFFFLIGGFWGLGWGFLGGSSLFGVVWVVFSIKNTISS